jgi:hypothetical protein
MSYCIMPVRFLGKDASPKGGICRRVDGFANRYRPISTSACNLKKTKVICNANYLFIFQPVVSGIIFGWGF